MAFVAIPNNDQYEYDNDPPDPGVGHPMRALWLKSSNGIRTEHGHSNYVRTRRIGSGDVDHGELSKSYWDARGDEDDLEPFTMTVRTTAANESFTIPAQDVGTFNATVDWGDGSTSAITAYNDANLVHTYASAGDHSISVSGTLPNIYFNNSGSVTKVIAVTNLGQVGWQTFEGAFRGCSNMTSFTPGVTDTSSVTNMSRMFPGCIGLTSLDLSSFDTSSVTDMSVMFTSCVSLTSIDLSSFDNSSVTTMRHMFYNCPSLTSIDLSGFNTSSVTDMFGMFRNCIRLTSLDLSSFDTSSVTDMINMFKECRAITSIDVSSFDTSSVTLMDNMFENCRDLTSLDVSNFDTSSITQMYQMFQYCYALTDIIGIENFDIEALNVTYALYNFMVGVTLPTSRYDALLVNWDAQDPLDNMTPNFGNSQYTAGGAAEAARANLISTDGWTISDGGALPAAFAMTVRTTAASETFTIPAQNVGTFNATIDWGDGSSSTVTTYNDANLAHTYASAGDHAISISGTLPNIYFNYTGDRLKVIAVTNLGQVGWQTFKRAFYGCSNMTSFTPGVTDTSSVTDMSYMFYSCGGLTSLDLSNLDTSSVITMNRMFVCINLTSLDVSSFDTSSVTNMGYMFHACRKLISLDLSNFDTSSVTNMDQMFNEHHALTSLDVSSFDTSSVTDMSRMFYGCYIITSLDVSSFDTSSVTNMPRMFYGCFDLISLDLSNFDTSSVTNMSTMFENCRDLTSLDVSNFDTSSTLYMNNMFSSCISLTSLDVSNFDTSSVTNMENMFYGCSVLTSLDVSSFDTSSVTLIYSMFAACSSLTDIVGVENFNIEALNATYALNSFITTTVLPTSRYDALLVNWDAQDPFDGMTPSFGNSKYTAGGTAAAARANLISTDGWTITDGGAVAPASFDMTVRTTAANEAFTIPCQNVGTFNATVDWGDGSTSTVTTYNASNLAHTYATAGDHAISISGTFPNINFNNAGDRLKVIAVTNLGQVGWLSFIDAFYGCENITSFTPGVTDTSSVTTMFGMFSSCTSITSLDVSSFDTSSVTDMTYMFSSCNSITSIDVSSFDTSSVTGMEQMFVAMNALTTLDLSNFDTSSVTNMLEMFWYCNNITSIDVSSFDTSSVTDMGGMFKECLRVTSLDVSSFDTSSVTNMATMFNQTGIYINNFDIVGVEDFDIEALNSANDLNDFMTSVELPTSRYDALLVNWDAQNPFDNMAPNFGQSRYTAGGTAATARANLISTDGWTITDGGTA